MREQLALIAILLALMRGLSIASAGAHRRPARGVGLLEQRPSDGDRTRARRRESAGQRRASLRSRASRFDEFGRHFCRSFPQRDERCRTRRHTRRPATALLLARSGSRRTTYGTRTRNRSRACTTCITPSTRFRSSVNDDGGLGPITPTGGGVRGGVLRRPLGLEQGHSRRAPRGPACW